MDTSTLGAVCRLGENPTNTKQREALDRVRYCSDAAAVSALTLRRVHIVNLISSHLNRTEQGPLSSPVQFR